MRTSLAARLGSRLLLTLALCACGEGGNDGGDDGGGSRADTGSATPGVQTAASTQPATAGGCTTPPPTFPLTLLEGAPWTDLQQALADSGVTFPDTAGNSDTLSVKLCPRCAAVRMAIRSSNRTPCLKRDDLAGSEPRIVGEYVLQEPFPGGYGWKAIPAGSTIYAFAQAPAGPAIMVYPDNGQTNAAPAASWQFWFCPHGGTVPGGAPQARWRSRFDSSHVAQPRPPRGDDGDGEDGDGDGGGSYGWMACASGCCQFYTPPPNPIIQDPVLPRAGASTSSAAVTTAAGPSWCPR